MIVSWVLGALLPQNFVTAQGDDSLLILHICGPPPTAGEWCPQGQSSSGNV